MEVWSHLYLKGFTRGYKIWYLHGERFEYGSSSEPQTADRLDEPTTDVDFGIGTVQMVYDAYGENLPSGEEEGDRQEQPNVENFPCEEEGEREQPNLEARRFFEMLDAAKQPLYQGCKDGHSPLSSASRLMALKTDYNLAEECVDAIADFVKDVLPEDNLAPGSYYEVQKLVAGLGLPYQVIDVCIDNCMIYWRADENRERCKFCRKPRYQDTTGRVPVPYKRMWYLPLTERLKRLYQSERTAEPMRWHAEHLTNGEITHPSDAEAWKHFQSTYPEFASERVFDSPPEEVSGKKLKEQLRDFGADRTPDVGGNGHEPIYGVGENHNWHKKSIFWDLPYWETHLLRHCLDVMHIEKNFFDNLMNTILDVQGKTKDNLKSRLDLVDICARPELHVDEHGKGPIPIYRLDATAKEEEVYWLEEP
ncbi:PREDICTED: uncharacterized protein LOC106331040 [Brassica oleracea var. oleracea]|uniref:uncharacterized protein LOC106331040 n=1 Tax=Brassica oleracea var. oleracea TaxID=109376 RepID=UPI0006A6CE14|nr:PREDICTED: uncharacterized protein LOC106331040 [Brassica oleracea var. oleracea]